MFNETQVTFSGRLGTDVTLRDVSGGQQVATFRVATATRRFREGEWVDGPTTWHTVKAWNRLARHVADSLRSGQPVLVHGRLVADSWTREDGSTTTSYAVVASSVGHDLVHGTAVFTRPEPVTRDAEGQVEEPPADLQQPQAA
jgi:single-strand DNA-binding protein